MSLKKAAQEVFKGWATPEEVQEFGKKLVADLEELGFRDRTIPKGAVPPDSTVTRELIKSGEDNIYHLSPGKSGDSMFLCGTAYQVPGGGKIPPRVVYIGLNAGRTCAIGILDPDFNHPKKSFQWKDREDAEKEIVEWLSEHAGNDVRSKIGWTDAVDNLFKKPAP